MPRIIGVDIPGNKKVEYALRYIYGIGPAIIKQMSRQVSPGSAGEYQADEQAGVGRLRWRVSGR